MHACSGVVRSQRPSASRTESQLAKKAGKDARRKFAVPNGVLDPKQLSLSNLVLRSSILRILAGHRGLEIPFSQQVRNLPQLFCRTRGQFCGSGRVFERTFVAICSLLAPFLLCSLLLVCLWPNFVLFLNVQTIQKPRFPSVVKITFFVPFASIAAVDLSLGPLGISYGPLGHI